VFVALFLRSRVRKEAQTRFCSRLNGDGMFSDGGLLEWKKLSHAFEWAN
jgi:hypothetical protein